MVFSSIPVYLDPLNWQQHQNHQLRSNTENPELSSSVKPNSMADRARLTKVPHPEAALKCPRCESTNTKFCYYNNYNLSQPRHFCKTCRRYWTRGGALRNIPVGGGCRINKRSKSSSSSKSSDTTDRQRGTNSVSSSSTVPQEPPQIPHLTSLHHFTDYSGMNTRLNFCGIRPPDSTSGSGCGGNEMDFQLGFTSGTGGGAIFPATGGGDQWQSQQVQQFPFLGGVEPPLGLYPFQGESVHHGYEPVAEAGVGQVQVKPSGSEEATQMASVKMEENEGLNITRQFSGISGNDHYWGGGNAWADLSGFGFSSTTHFL